MSRIYWDSMLFIYWIEDHPKYGARVGHILDRMVDRDDILCTSTFTLAEVLTGPVKQGDQALAAQIREAFQGAAIQLLPFSSTTAEIYANIRGRLGFSPVDAIHLASAAEANTDLFLTNDDGLIGKRVPGIQFVASMNANLF